VGEVMQRLSRWLRPYRLRVDEKHAVRYTAACFALALNGCSSTMLIYPRHGNHYGHAYYGIEFKGTH
jgi:hypothetical protein